MLRIMQERTCTTRNATFVATFYMNFCKRMLTFPTHYHHALSKKTKQNVCPNDTPMYALSTKSNDY